MTGIGIGSLHSSQSGQSQNGQATQRLEVEWARGISGKRAAQTDPSMGVYSNKGAFHVGPDIETL